MERDKIKERVRAILPWLISGSLLGYALYSYDLGEVANSFRQAKAFPYIIWAILLIIFWLFTQSLFIYLCLKWFITAKSPSSSNESADAPINFQYTGIVRAYAASYVLHLLNFFLAYGGLVVFFNRRYGVSYKRGSAVMMMTLLHATGALGLLAWLCVKLVPPELVSETAAQQLELAGTVGFFALVYYLVCFIASRIGRFIPGSRDRDHFFTPFIWTPAYAWPILLCIHLVQMGTHGLFTILTMPAFGLHPPELATLAFTQVVTMTRGLPISALGIGLDQVTIPFLFQGFGDPGKLLAFSIAYTFSQIMVRFIIGLPFFNQATKEMFEKKPEETQ